MMEINFVFSWEHSEVSGANDSLLGCFHQWTVIYMDVETPVDGEIKIFIDRVLKKASEHSSSEDELVDNTVHLINFTVLHELVHSLGCWDDRGINWAVKNMLCEV